MKTFQQLRVKNKHWIGCNRETPIFAETFQKYEAIS